MERIFSGTSCSQPGRDLGVDRRRDGQQCVGVGHEMLSALRGRLGVRAAQYLRIPAAQRSKRLARESRRVRVDLLSVRLMRLSAVRSCYWASSTATRGDPELASTTPVPSRTCKQTPCSHSRVRREDPVQVLSIARDDGRCIEEWSTSARAVCWRKRCDGTRA